MWLISAFVSCPTRSLQLLFLIAAKLTRLGRGFHVAGPFQDSWTSEFFLARLGITATKIYRHQRPGLDAVDVLIHAVEVLLQSPISPQLRELKEYVHALVYGRLEGM